MMEQFDGLFEDDKSVKAKVECKGLFWRGKLNQFLSSHKSIEHRISLRFLKRLSCPGCQYCDWYWEMIQEDVTETTHLMDHIVEGGLYTYSVHISKDYESGHHEVDYSEFTRVKEDTDETKTSN
jgi:hypothetical protein